MNPTTTFILNRILSKFNLEWTDVGLRYNHKLKFGSISYHVTSDFNKVIDFLGLPYEPTDDLDSLYHCVINSPYFEPKCYTKNSRPEDKGYEQFVAKIREDKPTYKLPRNAERITHTELIDKHFGTNLYRTVSMLNKAGLNNKELRNKFNGRLVMKWSGMTPGPLLINTIEEFKSFVESKYNREFLGYLTTRRPKDIRVDFLVFYNEMDYKLVDNNLPF